MAKRFTPEQERILNEWARTAPELRRAFPYTSASNTQTDGFGFHLNKEVDLGDLGIFYIRVRQSDGLQSLDTTSTLTFNADSFYLQHGQPGEIIVNFRGSTGSSGVTDHGALTGLFPDDDHPQYLLRTETPPGFYGIVVKESDNSYVTRDDTVVFTSGDFNVADGADGKPTVTIVDSGIDHGSLGGLLDDDHPQYLLRTETPPGFYGIIVKESDESFVTRDDTIVFTSSDFNVADVSGKPTVTIVDSGIDHGGLGGLGDDDHPQYARKLADWNTFRQGISAEAFYLKSGSSLSHEGIVLRDTGVTPPTPAAGRLNLWAEEALSSTILKFQNETGIILDVLADRVFTVTNETGSTIPAYTLVYMAFVLFGDEIPRIGIADSGSAATMPAIGITLEAIGSFDYGLIMSYGTITGQDTFSFSVGDELFLGSGGAFTNVRPTTNGQFVGSVINADFSPNGSILMNVSGTDAPGDGGFYGIVIKESDGSFVTRDDTIVFTSSDFNVADVSGKPTVTIVDSGIDHGALTGLADDDHPQYARKAAPQVTFDGIVTAEAFYLAQGGDVFAYSFNREHFYVTPAKSNIGRKVVNLDADAVAAAASLEVSDGTNEYPSVNKINFNAVDFYLSGDLNGEPVVNLVGLFKYRNPDVKILNTVEERDIINVTIPGNSLSLDKTLKFRSSGIYNNTTGSGRTMIYKIYWNGVIIYQGISPSFASGLTSRVIRLEGTIDNTIDLQTQFMQGVSRFGAPVAPTVGYGTLISSAANVDSIFASAGPIHADSTQPIAFRTSITPSAAADNYKFYFHVNNVEII